MEFQFDFHTIAIAIIKLFVLMAVGYILYWRKIIDDRATDMLSMLLIRVIFPALIISRIITHFSFKEYSYWAFLPFCAIVFGLTGMAIAAVFYRFLKGAGPKKEFICSCSFQNAGYLPMTLIAFSFAGAAGDTLLIYTFLFSAGFNILMWSLVPLFLSGKLKSEFKMSVLLNPPVVATVFALLWVTVLGKGSMPLVLMDPLRQLGYAAFPLGMMVLGAYLCRYQAHDIRDKVPLITCVGIKLLLFPALVLLALVWTPLNPELKFFLFLEGTMPTAVSLVIIGSYTGADNKFLSGSIFYTHLIAIVSIPLWLAVFHAVVR
jgi:predicted permease